jgi:Tol biopolymer transport system component
MSLAYEKRGTAGSTRLRLGPLPVEHPHMSPDGLWILFEGKSADENRDIFVSMITGEPRVRATSDPGIDFDPVWRPAPSP